MQTLNFSYLIIVKEPIVFPRYRQNRRIAEYKTQNGRQT